MILPECFEAQFGWVYRFDLHAGYVRTSSPAQVVNSYRISLIDSGHLQLNRGTTQLHAHGGSVLLLPPTITPSEVNVTRSIVATTAYNVGFRLLLFGSIDITGKLTRLEVWHPTPSDFSALHALIRLLLEKAHPQTLSASFLRDGLMRAILGLCWEPMNGDSIIDGIHPLVPEWLTLVMQEIRHHPNITVSELERLTGHCHSHFFNLFQQYVGLSPRVYLQRYRLDLAKHLLTTTSMSIADIAEHIGFVNVSNFTRFFRSAFSTTPSDYRQSVQLLEEVSEASGTRIDKTE